MANNFKADLAYGQLGETFVSELGKNVSIEVKRDRKALDTGNIFFEVECNGKPSGIMSSEAAYLVHLVPKGSANVAGLILELSALKKAIRMLVEAGQAQEKNWSGDGGRVKGIILNMDLLGKLITTMGTKNEAS